MNAPALIVIDMLNDFLRAWAPSSRQRLVQSTNALVGILRGRSRPIVWVRQEFQPDLRDAFPEMRAKGIRITIQGTEGSQIVSDLAVAPSDPVVIKKRYSAFYGTTLDGILMAAIDAYQRDWEVILAADCVDSYDREHHDISLRYMNGKIASVMSNEEIRRMLAPTD